MTFAVWQQYGGATGPSVAGVPTGSTWEEFIPWWDDWNRARSDLSTALDSFTAKVNEVQSCIHPLGLSDTSLPLYFIDPQGTNAKFFASSDYLLQGFAGPAVAEATSAFEAARTAMVQARESEIRQVQSDQDRDRRLEQLYAQYGRPLAEACGLNGTPEEVLSGFLDGEYALENCHRVPAEEDPACESFIRRVWETTEERDERPPECGPLSDDNGMGILELREDWCLLLYEYAEYVHETSVKNRNPRDVAKTEKNAFARLAVAEEWPSFRPGLAAWLGGRFTDYKTMTLDNWLQLPSTAGDDFIETFNRASPPFGPWDLLDNLAIDECGTGLKRTPHGTSVGRDVVNLGCELAYAGKKGYNSSAAWSCPPEKDCVSCDAIEWRGRVWCDELLATRPYPNDFVDPQALLESFPDPVMLAQCYRGTLASMEVAVLQARQAVRAAEAGIDAVEARYDLQVRTCIQLSDIHQQKEDAMEAHYQAVKELRETRGLLGGLGSALNVVAKVGGAVAAVGSAVVSGGVTVPAVVASGAAVGASADGAHALASFGQGIAGLDEKMSKLQHEFEMTQASLQGQASAIQCWSEASAIMNGMTSQVETAKQSLLAVTAALVQGDQALRSAENTLEEARIMLIREANRLEPEIRHHFWYDERAKKFETTMEWARKVLYLSMLALEYEVQASLGMGAMILGATHPNELEDALRELRGAQASRGINGNRPEEKTVVYSLRDELLQLSDKLSPDRPSAEKQASRREEMIDILKSPQSAVFDSKGNYLGQALRFHVKPKGPLEYRCAERLWGISATVEGDLFGVLEPRLPVFILKQNTFRSQWCEGQSPDGSQYQIGMMRPSLDLFRPGTQQGQAGETEAWSWAYVDAWLNVPRRSFASETYSEGDSEELAGRGLYGEYMLILPAWGFLDTEVELEHIEDLLIRFEYVSVNDGGSFGPSPTDPEAAAPRTEIEDFVVTASKCQVDISWKPPNTPRFDGVRVYPHASQSILAPEDAGEELDCNEFGKSCTADLLPAEPYYTAFAFDDWGDVFDAATTLVSPSPPISSFGQVGDSLTTVQLDWTPLEEEETCLTTAIWRDGTVKYQGGASTFQETTVSGPNSSSGELRKWTYQAKRCLGPSPADCVGPEVTLSASNGHAVEFGSLPTAGWSSTSIGPVTLAGEPGVGLTGSTTSSCMRRLFDPGGTPAQFGESVTFKYWLQHVSTQPAPSLCLDVSILNSTSTSCTLTSHWTQLACVPLASAWTIVDVPIPAEYRNLNRQLRFRMSRSHTSDIVAIQKVSVWPL